MPTVYNRENIGSLIDIEALYQYAPCGYVSFIPDGTIIKVNHTLLEWLGEQEDDLLFKKKFSDLISKGGNMHFEMFFRPMINVHGKVKELSYELMGKEGEILPVLLSATTIRDGNNKIAAINAALYEITDRKKFEKELVIAKKQADLERKRFAFLADLIPEIIWTADTYGHIDYVNERFFQYFNIDHRIVHSRRLLLRIHPEERKLFMTEWRACFGTGRELNITLRLEGEQGIHKWHLIKGAPHQDEYGKLTKWFGSCFNIDDHVKALQKKDDFISIASHELKTPVTSLKASLQLLDRLKSEIQSKKIISLIDQAIRNAGKVNTLISDLLNASQMSQGQLHLNKKSFYISEILKDCCNHLNEDLHRVTFEGDVSLTLFGDQDRISQVITNFINNAVKYAPQSKIIKISVRQLSKSIKVAVIDDGPGISKDKQEHLFDRYYRVDSNGAQVSGLGLGLYISAEIIRKHDGTIGVDSSPGKGASFWFTIPLSEE
ncbi:PAS domain S-box-containing protein [Pedobacter sp. W3I1]|uniref:sensor histidine kinase n=1 Tax=Pedobacter sp. W3I1 TaxID=3042291 RepID=UPI0027845AE7|nr:PAS domain-containing sensor histidine kinase [Pedobacter sp. W3I1]MDQ0638717.1 PAS domain S-box-containing protein [Pedobacter sp. W3I1]